MKKSYLFLLVIAGCCITASVAAQKKPAVKSTKAVKYKVPKMTTTLGSYGDSLGLAPGEIERIAGLPLTVVDEHKAVYTVTSYQFLYKKIVVSETEDGRAIPATSMVSQYFTATPLPDVWVGAVRENLKKGEELYFFDIIARDPTGRVMYAPNLKITVK